LDAKHSPAYKTHNHIFNTKTHGFGGIWWDLVEKNGKKKVEKKWKKVGYSGILVGSGGII
jgi:hypothetical protein